MSAKQLHLISLTILFVAALGSPIWAQSQDVLPPIPRGDVAVHLQPLVTGMGAPLYGVSAPGDTSRMYVLEQKGLIQILQNGALLPTPALDMQSNLAMNVANANEERGLLGLTFHPGYNDPTSPGYRTLYTYE